ncbi:MAG: hypothetical protein HGA47_09695 [Zoogloea sp.]|nr:hypothetical protein [Zoogloea sp.]
MTLRIPVSAWIMGVLGALCLAIGLLLLVLPADSLPPVLAGTGAALAIIVSGVALVGSAAFPVALARLADRDENA